MERSLAPVLLPNPILHAPRCGEAEVGPAPGTVAGALTGPGIPQGQVVPKAQEQFAMTSRKESVLGGANASISKRLGLLPLCIRMDSAQPTCCAR